MQKVFGICFFWLMTLSIHSCTAIEKTPGALVLCFEYLDKKWNKEKREEFKVNSEEDIVSHHFGIGLHIRNYLLRNHRHSKQITSYFYSKEIYHFDEMSSIILTSYHRYLNGKNIELKPQIDEVHEYWKPIIACEENQKKNAEKLRDQYDIGDTVRIQIPVGETNSVHDYPCPEENMKWDFVEERDLEIEGIITDEYYINDPANLFFTVKILTKNHLDTEVMMNEAKIGDEFKVRLITAWKIFPN